jgi:hypothetical protein
MIQPKILFPKLSKHITSFEKYLGLIDKLVLKVKNNQPISDNPMLDGMMIGWWIKNEIILSTLILTEDNVGRILDGTMQQLEQVTLWILNNEDKLINL